MPPVVDIHEHVTLSCHFDTDSEKLYSVKWYKDEFEFFRFMPGNSPRTLIFPRSGVTLDVSHLILHDVYLVNTINVTWGNSLHASRINPMPKVGLAALFFLSTPSLTALSLAPPCQPHTQGRSCSLALFPLSTPSLTAPTALSLAPRQTS